MDGVALSACTMASNKQRTALYCGVSLLVEQAVVKAQHFIVQ